MDLDEGTPLGDGTSVVAQNGGRGSGGTARAIDFESEDFVYANWGDGRHEGYYLKDSEQDEEAKEAKEGGRGYRKLGMPNAPSTLGVTKCNPTLESMPTIPHFM